MNRCAFPSCKTPLIDPATNTVLAEICHIEAQNAKGPRFNPKQSPEERHGFDNLVLMCGAHHKVIDAPENLSVYSVAHLIQLKKDHEQAAHSSGIPIPALADADAFALQLAAVNYAPGAVHMDFKGATFKVGGEGGGFAGGGGGGGILTIIGTTRIPEGAKINLKGDDGKAPGAGGGGAGAIEYIGRAATLDDLSKGLRASTILTANATAFSGSLLNLLGGAWTYIAVSALPFHVRIQMVVVLELGSIAPETLLRLEIHVADPKGATVKTVLRDIAVPVSEDLVKRFSLTQILEFDLTEWGVWTIKLMSSEIELGAYSFECRQSINH